MSKEYAKLFYDSRQWKRVSSAYMTSKNYICERCGSPGVICHHKIYINPGNISNPSITLNTDNLECLCANCHNEEHKPKHNVTVFDTAGNVARVKEAKDLTDYSNNKDKIDDLIKQAKSLYGV